MANAIRSFAYGVEAIGMLNLRLSHRAGRAFAILLVALSCIVPIAAVAHPLGNFTTNHLTRIDVSARGISLRYVLDLAEIPTVALEHTLAVDGRPSHAQLQAWADDHAVTIAPQLHLEVDSKPVDLGRAVTSVRLRPGAAGLQLLYYTADFHAPLPAHATRLQYADDTALGRIGWKDVVLSPAREPTHELLTYPSALVGSPRARTTIAASIDASGAAHQVADAPSEAFIAPAPSVSRMDALSAVLAKNGAGPLFILGAILLAIGLGALHALEPGHGKTLLAVSLVGARATTRQAFILAVALTIAHTIGVLVLGAIVLFATRWIVPEAVYPWITLLSGGLVAVLGARALAREIQRRRPVAHEHAHAHPLAHPHAHDHAHGLGTAEHHHDDVPVHDHSTLDDEAHALAHAIPGSAPLTFRTAVFAAASGNIAPCPAALVVLLAAISLHRIGFGMTLIIAFSIGLAVTLTTLGIAVVRGAAWLSGRPQFARLSHWAPMVSAGAIALVGSVMLGQGLVAQGVGLPLPIVAGLTIMAILGYAFTLPHRHVSTGSAHA